MVILNLLLLLKNYWTATMTISFIELLVITAACITFYRLPGLPNMHYVMLVMACQKDYVQSELHKRTFINRMIFSNCY